MKCCCCGRNISHMHPEERLVNDYMCAICHSYYLFAGNKYGEDMDEFLEGVCLAEIDDWFYDLLRCYLEDREEELVHTFLSFAEKHYHSIDHPVAVAYRFKPLSDEWIVGLYHDILEDTDLTTEELEQFLNRHNKRHLLDAIIEITRKPDETYMDYIARLDGIAKTVKIADIEDHLDRKETLKTSLYKRYQKALKILK